MKRITIEDVAKKANVSKSTVSQYLNKRYHRMSEDTKERIKNVIEELDYRPNLLAGSLKKKSTSTIGLIAANILHSFTIEVIRSIENVLHKHDFNLIICNADEDPVKEKKYIHTLRAKQVDGIIAFPTDRNIDIYNEMMKSNFPIIFIDRLIPEMSIPTFLLDNKKAANLAVQQFINNGYEKVGIITTSTVKNITPRKERVEGYKETLKLNHIPINNNYIKSLEINDMEKGILEMFSSKKPPEAILAGNDLTLVEVLKFVKKYNFNIPGDFSLIGIDEVPFANFYNPTITTVSQPTFEIGINAAEYLINKIKKNNMDSDSEIYRFSPSIILRESSK